MKSILLSSVAAMAFLAGGQAFAADVPVKAPPPPVVNPVTDWGGFYFGVKAGGARNQPDPWTFPFAPLAAPVIEPHGSSWAAAIFTGTNFQFGHLVLGTETNYIFTDLNNTGVCPSGNICKQRTQNIFLFGGRAGLAWNDWFVFGSGGYSATNLESNVFSVVNGAFADSGQHWHSGWYAGGGLEWAATPNIHVGIDYTHIRANTRQDATLPIVGDDRVTGDKIDMLMARVSFKLWSGLWGPFSK